MKKKREFEPVYTPILNIKPSYSTLYAERLDGRARAQTEKFTQNKLNLQFNETGGIISKKAKKNIATAIDWLLFAARPKKVVRTSNNSIFFFKINFVTLTLSSEQKHSDQEIKSEILDKFLQRLRDDYGLKNYLWRAEAQENGNIHFHLVTDIFLHYLKIRDLWNECQEKLGYVSSFAEKYGHTAPNSTDIHSIRNLKNVAGYLSKYCCKNICYIKVPSAEYSLKKEFQNKGLDSKNVFKKQHTDLKWCIHDITEDQRAHIEKLGFKITTPRMVLGRLWYLSKSLQKMKGLKIYIEEENSIKNEFSKMYDRITADLIKRHDFCTSVFWKAFDFVKLGAKSIFKKILEFTDHLKPANESEIIYEV